MDWNARFDAALPYAAFLDAHASPAQRVRWDAARARARLAADQQALLASFRRKMPVFCLAGAWCGDCMNQCTILDAFAEAAPAIDLRFFDRDADPALREALAINGGQRVPVAVFLSEDFHEVARFGDRTLVGYRRLAAEQLGDSCPTGIVPPDADFLAAVAGEWLGHFERVQILLRLSGRLRQRHGD